jgi:uncharacterized LabA/DUF88 family protein
MLKTMVQVDLWNINRQLRELGRRPDLPALRAHLANPAEGRFCVDAICYAPLPQENGDRVHRWHDWLRGQGFRVVSKRAKKLPDGSTKCSLDIHIVLDAIQLAQEIRPDVMVIASGDGDFAELALRLRRRGIHVECASLPGSLASELRLACLGFSDLSDWANDCEKVTPDAPEIGAAAHILEPL